MSFNLAQYTGAVPPGEYTVRITKVEAAKTKNSSEPMLKVTAHFIDLDVDQTWNYLLRPSMLFRLRQDLEQAEALREGDSYPDLDQVEDLAAVIFEDLSSKVLTVEAAPARSGDFMNYKVLGVSFS